MSIGESVLGYWDTRGRAQPIRLLLEYTETKFQDKYYKCGPAPDFDKSCWFDIKFSLGMNFPNLPYFKTADGTMITQSNAILRHIARANDLCGKTEAEKGKVDILENQSMDFRNGLVRLCYSDKFESLKPKYLESLKTTLQLYSDFLGDNKFFCGNSITFPDFIMYELLDQHRILEPTCFKQTANLEKFLTRIEELPTIKAYMASDRFMKAPLNNKMAAFGN